MLVTFKTKAAPDLYMFEENARQILDLFGKDVRQGIITADQTGDAVRILEEEIARKKIEEARERAEQEAKEREEEEQRFREDEKEDGRDSVREQAVPEKKDIPVPFSTRAYPFLQMLKAAHKKERDIVWGV